MQSHTEAVHRPVMLEEALAALQIKEDGIYIDATYGRGGHSQAILSALGRKGRLLAFDRDAEAVADAMQRFSADPRFTIVRAPFSQLQRVVSERGWLGKVDGLLCDLGVSSPQLDSRERGFSFRADGPLDMRMDQRQALDAAGWLASADEREIADVLHNYGEERYARRIARAIVARRQQAPITTTSALREIIVAALPVRERQKDPATRSFQALRIRINDELTELEQLLNQALTVLAPGARLVMISFHSLEDRIVKRFMREHSRPRDHLPREIPVAAAPLAGELKVVGKLVTASAAELADNPRSRSAKLRVAERCA